ncbi:ras association domain-containing protein 8-like isoform X1 [Hemiscyllium ocellatum]|uniref:ras association domain-containing protein 8-like isoform X1 n=1 Tax=Hemiscyllium ocellatum TaxID=170820 RepID=UPI002966619F|nr:ras association domain-containing protein 8-like isoform X1 [Hemiscyllium ocellatum]
MELKVWVDGVQRVVCGVNEKTTCQEVVIALAQAMGRTGRYTLKEKWKDIERHFTPEEKLLSSLSKWGQKTKDVQLILNRTGPSLNLWPVSDKHRGPERNVHRQSLPPLAKLRNKSDKNSHVKEAKRKSLNFAEGAREWLGSFGKSKEGKVKGKDSEPEKKASNSDHRPGEELNQLLQRQQEKLTSLQAELEASEAEIAKLQEDHEPSTHTEIVRIQELIDERSAEAEEVEFWENELKAEQLHGGELREQLEEVKEKLEECEEKLRNCLLKAQGLAADLEVVRSQREQQEAKSCHDIRIKVEELKEEITVKSQKAVRLEEDVRLVEKVIERVENEIQRKRCELEDLTRELRQVNLLQFIQQTGTKVSILPAQEGPTQVIESRLHQNSPENEILPAKAKVLQYLMVSSFNREGIYV